MKKILMMMLGVASFCCAQLMPAKSVSKPMTSEDSLKALKIHAPVDYSIPVDPSVTDADTPRNADENQYYRRPRAKKSSSAAVTALKVAATWTGFIAGSIATGAITESQGHVSDAMYHFTEFLVDGVVDAVTGESSLETPAEVSAAEQK